MLEAPPPEYLQIHQDGQKSRLISSVSQQIRSLGTRFHSTNTLLQKSHLDATLRTAIDSEIHGMPWPCSSSYKDSWVLQNIYIQVHIPLASFVTLIGCWSH